MVITEAGQMQPRTRRSMGYFDRYPRFAETSTTASKPGRLNRRHDALIEANLDVLRGARVLDIASHDGRWTLAALEAGAKHVTGIEARGELVQHARETLELYGFSASMYRFVTGDVFEALESEALDIDVVMCFGFLYHTLRYPELFAKLRRLEPRHLLLDTKVKTGKGRLIKLGVDKAPNQGQAAEDSYGEGAHTLIGSPTQPALRLMLRVYGFDIEHRYDWQAAAEAAGRAPIGVYQRGERVSWRCRYDPSVRPVLKPPAADD